MTAQINRLKEAQRNGLRIEIADPITRIFWPLKKGASYPVGDRVYRIDPSQLPQPPLEIPDGWEEIFDFEKDGRFWGKCLSQSSYETWDLEKNLGAWGGKAKILRYIVRSSDIEAYYSGLSKLGPEQKSSEWRMSSVCRELRSLLDEADSILAIFEGSENGEIRDKITALRGKIAASVTK